MRNDRDRDHDPGPNILGVLLGLSALVLLLWALFSPR